VVQEGAFGSNIDYAMLLKLYGEPSHSREASGRCSPTDCVGTRTDAITGNPDPKHISTRYAERANLTMRMHMRRFTRPTHAFSKKIENHAHMVALYTLWYNFVRHKDAARYPRDGRWRNGSAVVDGRSCGAVRAYGPGEARNLQAASAEVGRFNFKLRHYPTIC
jgi:hypothetical protein